MQSLLVAEALNWNWTLEITFSQTALVV